MRAKRLQASAMLAAAISCPACRTVDRAGEDALVVGTFPVHAVTMPYDETSRALRDDGASPWVSPLIFAMHLAEDVAVTAISAGDLGISPVLGVVELTSHEDASLRPLRMYSFDQFPPEFQKWKARQVESDVAKAAVQGAVVVLVVGAFVAATYYGHGDFASTDWRVAPPPGRKKAPNDQP